MPPIRKRLAFSEEHFKENRLQLAKTEREQGLWPSQRAAAKAHNVPVQTLNDRVNGRLTRRQAHESPAAPADVPAMSAANHSRVSDMPSTSHCPTLLPCSRMPSDDPSVVNSVPRTPVECVSDCLTRSQQASQKASMVSSLAASISVVLDPSRVPESYDELKTEFCKLRMELSLMKRDALKSKAEAKANNARCTIMTRAALASKAELKNQKRKTRRSVKTNARLISHTMLIGKHEAERKTKALRAREAAEAEAHKAAEEALREARIQEEIKTRTFTEPLPSYKRKDDLIALSGALGLKTSGTVSELTAQLRAHLTTHPEIQHNARFSGLFLTRRRRVENVVLLED